MLNKEINHVLKLLWVAVAIRATGVESLWEADSGKTEGCFVVSVEGAALRLLSPS